jgi:hypothetical protein
MFFDAVTSQGNKMENISSLDSAIFILWRSMQGFIFTRNQ